MLTKLESIWNIYVHLFDHHEMGNKYMTAKVLFAHLYMDVLIESSASFVSDMGKTSQWSPLE